MRMKKYSASAIVITAVILTGLIAPRPAAAQDPTLIKWFWTSLPISWYTDLAWRVYDGTGYICENGHNSDYIYMVNPDEVPNGGFAGNYVAYSFVQPSQDDIGLAWDSDNNCWWGTNPWENHIGFKLPAEGGTRATFTWNCHRNPTGITYDPNHQLLMVASNTRDFIQLWTYDGSNPNNRPQDAGSLDTGFTSIGVVRIGDHYWVSNEDPMERVYELTLAGQWTGRSIRLPEGRKPWGLAFDGQYLWVKSNAPDKNTSNKVFQYDVGFVPPSPTPAPTPAKPVLDSGDYDGDSTSDIAVFRPSSGLWAIKGVTRIYFGRDGDIPASGDFQGNGTTDIALFRPASGLWAIKGVTRVYFGVPGDIPVPGDYTGDGTVDAAVFRPASGLWAVRGGIRSYFGAAGDIPVPSYLDGRDEPKKIGIFRPATGLWASPGIDRVYFGTASDLPVMGSYDSDSDEISPAVFRPANGLWAVLEGDRNYFGQDGDLPVPGNYTGFLPDDLGIFRESSGLWAIKGVTRTYFGTSGDIPVSGISINPSSASVL